MADLIITPRKRFISWVFILSDISIILRTSHKTIFVGILEKPHILAWGIFETSRRRHGIDIFFDICWRRLKDVTQKISLLKCFWEVSEMFLSMEIWLRSLRDISCRLGWCVESSLLCCYLHSSYIQFFRCYVIIYGEMSTCSDEKPLYTSFRIISMSAVIFRYEYCYWIYLKANQNTQNILLEWPSNFPLVDKTVNKNMGSMDTKLLE